ncbi:MAG: alkaline phosphatase family protein, partial [Pseudobdellovibrionaceae bacterium]|nr:alkaline phosphatase family protein [Pseudobdellovibrionaceae bacterium]
MIFRSVPRVLAFMACLAGLAPTTSWAQMTRLQKPKLIVTLVVDQFRADQIARFQKRFAPPLGPQGEPGGFRYLTEYGAYYPFAEFDLLQNMTCPGHATILSGAYAYQHGIPVNIWYDARTQKSQYCVEDSDSPLVGLADANSKRGISPKHFRGTTLGDELKNSGYPSRVITIALKDRAAVLLGGKRADLAVWLDKESQTWVSSRYYLPNGKLPDWVQSLNASLQTRGETLTWDAPKGLGSGTSWTSNQHVVASKTTEAMGRDFPHQVSSHNAQSSNFPEGTVWTVNTAIQALQTLKLGQGPEPDLLAVSFSNHDGLSHSFGPNSRELEELMLVEDREIARLLAAIKKAVGLDQSIIVLTG